VQAHIATPSRVVGFDTETCLIRPAILAPPLVCITWQERGGQPQIIHARDAESLVRGWLLDPLCLLVGHNVAYDLAVIAEAYPNLRSLIFDAYAADRVTDTMLRQQLLDIAAGVYRGSVAHRGKQKGKRVVYEYNLEALAKRNAGIILQKDAWRLSYAEFLDTPLEQWPTRAREVQAAAAERVKGTIAELESVIAADKKSPVAKELQKEIDGLRSMISSDPGQCLVYPLEDARATLAVYEAQEKHAAYLADQYRQARAAWALHLSSAWGVRTDADGVEALRLSTQAELEEVEEELQMLGLVRADGSRDTKAAKARMVEVCRRDDLPIVRTDAHFKEDAECGGADECEEHVCLDGDACESSGDDVLISYAARTTLAKQLSNDIPALARGVEYPIHTRYGMAATGRTTSSKPNIQNQSKRPGFREAFVARPGKVFAEADFPGLELYTWAQCCKSWFGFSALADALNVRSAEFPDGLDPHLWVASLLLGISYAEAKTRKKEPEVIKARNLSKPGNFGFAGGMGIPKFVVSTRKIMERAAFDALGLNEESGKILKDKWSAAWPESGPHFARVRELCNNESKRANVETLFTQRHRAGATYCAAANNGFQALGADCAKEAMWRVARAQYVTPASPLYNTRTVAFVHDELIVEVDEGPTAHDAAQELARLMVEGANVYLPDVPIPLSKMEPLLMRRWAKAAVSTFDANGRLIPWS
jgi:DNA polymerase-1